MEAIANEISAIIGILSAILTAIAWIGGVIWKSAKTQQRVLDRLELYGVIAQDHENRIRGLEGKPPGKILNFPKNT